MRDEGLLLPAEYQKQRRELAKDRRAAFAKNPTTPNQVWQLDFWRVRDHPGRHLAHRRVQGLVLKVRVPFPYLAHGEAA